MGAFVNRSFIVPYLNGGQVVHVLLAASPLFSRSLELRQGSPFHPFVSDDGSSRRKLRAESHAPDQSKSVNPLWRHAWISRSCSCGLVRFLRISEASILSCFFRHRILLASVILPSASLFVSACLFGAPAFYEIAHVFLCRGYVFPAIIPILQHQHCNSPTQIRIFHYFIKIICKEVIIIWIRFLPYYEAPSIIFIMK